jgi:2-polyprenyl-3-methyl-5-hydroxy-6-metoxy-1,4-benzoquinol methylase
MTPVIASATELPFQADEFDVVVASDVLEHIPPELRQTVIGECLRAARKLVIFGFPCGQLAWQADRDLLGAYVHAKITPPVWLTEHMDAPFPEPELIHQLDGWKIEQQGNESIRFHSWLMRREMSRAFVRFSSIVSRVAPWLVEPLLQKADREPCYRQIFALNKTPSV